ncbi:hypothetical protein ABWH93_18540 [Seohaeicola saemankumensis]|uniref:hypothetical protein n=1 Tax=Seohaeicola TaxID=481178 RepID=UPI0035CE9351
MPAFPLPRASVLNLRIRPPKAEFATDCDMEVVSFDQSAAAGRLRMIWIKDHSPC